MMCDDCSKIKAERDRYRALLEAAEYPNLDNLMNYPIEFSAAVGKEVAKRTKELNKMF